MKVDRRSKFFDSVANMMNQLNSSHPFDKEIIQELLDGGMSQDDVEHLRELVLKASKAYYSGQKENKDRQQ